MSESAGVVIAIGVMLGMVFSAVVTCFTGVTGILADIWSLIASIRDRRTKLLIDAELARHGLTSDMVVEALEKLPEFRFYMYGTECIARKGPDGHHQFMATDKGIECADCQLPQYPADSLTAKAGT